MEIVVFQWGQFHNYTQFPSHLTSNLDNRGHIQTIESLRDIVNAVKVYGGKV